MFSYLPLAKTLKEKSMSARELGIRLGVEPIGFRRSLNKSQYITVATLMRICEVLSCDISDVIEWKEGEQNISPMERLSLVEVDWDKVKNAMISKGYSAKRLSLDLGHSGNFIQLSKTRNSKFRPADFDLLCKLLEVSPEELI